MKIKMNTVVSITFDLKDADGNILESTKEPVTYLHGGHDNIFPKVEEAIHGKKIGEMMQKLGQKKLLREMIYLDSQRDDIYKELLSSI